MRWRLAGITLLYVAVVCPMVLMYFRERTEWFQEIFRLLVLPYGVVLALIGSVVLTFVLGLCGIKGGRWLGALLAPAVVAVVILIELTAGSNGYFATYQRGHIAFGMALSSDGNEGIQKHLPDEFVVEDTKPGAIWFSALEPSWWRGSHRYVGAYLAEQDQITNLWSFDDIWERVRPHENATYTYAYVDVAKGQVYFNDHIGQTMSAVQLKVVGRNLQIE